MDDEGIKVGDPEDEPAEVETSPEDEPAEVGIPPTDEPAEV